jgi:hypothetical protein
MSALHEPHPRQPTALSPMTAQGRVRVPQHVVYRRLASETVMLNVQTGQYHGLNPTAGRMLEVLESQPEFDAAIALLLQEMEADEELLRADLLRLCRELQQRGLIEVVA